MIKIDFKVPFVNEAGQTKEATLAQVLSPKLAEKEMNVKLRKAVGWSRALAKGEVLVLDDSDFTDLQAYVTNHPELTAIFKVQVLEVMDESKDKAKSK